MIRCIVTLQLQGDARSSIQCMLNLADSEHVSVWVSSNGEAGAWGGGGGQIQGVGVALAVLDDIGWLAGCQRKM